jgi:hypothetical protein
MGRTQVTGVVLLATLALLACDGQGTAPPDEILLGTQLVHGLELRLSIDSTTTTPGGTFTATLAITNRRDSAARLISGCTQLARGAVYRASDEEPQWFMGASGGCYTALSEYRLEVGESFEQVWNARAARQLYLGESGWDIVPASEGDYFFRVSPDVITIDQEAARLPELEVAFRVR